MERIQVYYYLFVGTFFVLFYLFVIPLFTSEATELRVNLCYFATLKCCLILFPSWKEIWNIWMKLNLCFSFNLMDDV